MGVFETLEVGVVDYRSGKELAGRTVAISDGYETTKAFVDETADLGEIARLHTTDYGDSVGMATEYVDVEIREWEAEDPVSGTLLKTAQIRFDPDEPKCRWEPEDGHDWFEDGPFGEAGGVRYRADCGKCELMKIELVNCYRWGADQFRSGIVYEEMN